MGYPYRQVFQGTTGFQYQEGLINNPSTSGTVRQIRAEMTLTATSYGSGNAVGVRGAVIGNSGLTLGTGGFVYGTQGKFISTGTTVNVGSGYVCGIIGQLDLSSGTYTSGHIACVIASLQAGSQTIAALAHVNGVYIESAAFGSGGGMNSFVQGFGSVTTCLDFSSAQGPSGTTLLAIGTTSSCWSATNASTDAGKLAVNLVGVGIRYINLFVS